MMSCIFFFNNNSAQNRLLVLYFLSVFLLGNRAITKVLAKWHLSKRTCSVIHLRTMINTSRSKVQHCLLLNHKHNNTKNAQNK